MHLYTLLRNNSRKDIKHDVCYLEIDEHGLSLLGLLIVTALLATPHRHLMCCF
jgi:hypothetical protein